MCAHAEPRLSLLPKSDFETASIEFNSFNACRAEHVAHLVAGSGAIVPLADWQLLLQHLANISQLAAGSAVLVSVADYDLLLRHIHTLMQLDGGNVALCSHSDIDMLHKHRDSLRHLEYNWRPVSPESLQRLTAFIHADAERKHSDKRQFDKYRKRKQRAARKAGSNGGHSSSSIDVCAFTHIFFCI